MYFSKIRTFAYGALVAIMIVAVFLLGAAWSHFFVDQSSVSNYEQGKQGNEPKLDFQQLDVAYTTTSGEEVWVDEAKMYENLVTLVDSIKDAEVRDEWLCLIREQLFMDRNQDSRFFYVSVPEVNGQLHDFNWFGVMWESPEAGDITLLIDHPMLVYPERMADKERVMTLAGMAMVHELVHVRDWKQGRMKNLIELLNVPDEDWHDTKDQNRLGLESRLEMFATEIRAYRFAFGYLEEYRDEIANWDEIFDELDQESFQIYEAWEQDREDEFFSCIYDVYEEYFFPKPGWQVDDEQATKTWMLQNVHRAL